MNNIKFFIVILLIHFFVSDVIAQVERKYSIEECVNEFSMGRIEETKVGYQYWFANKNFLDGRTIKLSVVAPHSATHEPHSHSEDEFFFVLEGTQSFILTVKQKQQDHTQAFTARQIQSTE